MINTEFRCWINGYLELSDDSVLNKQQLMIIKNHANLVIAVAGQLEAPVQEFVAHLEEAVEKNNTISLVEMRQLAEKCFF